MKYIKQLFLAFSLVVAGALHAQSDAFKPTFVDTLVAPYLQIQKGLAADHLQAAQHGAKHFLAAMKQVPHKGDAHEEAMDLSNHVKLIASAAEISAARAAFLELSREVTSLIKNVGVTADTPLYAVYCPMAFDGKGGNWVQSDTQVANPYYGSMMLRCGSVKAQIAGESSKAEATSHSGHHH